MQTRPLYNKCTTTDGYISLSILKLCKLMFCMQFKYINLKYLCRNRKLSISSTILHCILYVASYFCATLNSSIVIFSYNLRNNYYYFAFLLLFFCPTEWLFAYETLQKIRCSFSLDNTFILPVQMALICP